MLSSFDSGFLRKPLNLFLLIFAAGSVCSIAIAQTAYGLAFLTWVIYTAARQDRRAIGTPFDWYFAAYLVIGTISVFFAAEKGIWLPFAKRIVLIPVIYLLATAVDNRRFLGWFVSTMLFVMVVFSFLGISIYLSGKGGLEGRLRLYNHYMTSGGILMLASLVSFGFSLVKAPWKMRLLSAAAGSIMLVPLSFTFTRSSWLGFIAGLTVMSLFQSRKMIIVLALAIVLFVFAAPDSMTDRAKSAFDPSHENNIERTYMWRAGYEMMKDNPATGVGDMDLSRIYRQYRSPDAAQDHGHLHNNLIMFGAMMGIPGLLVFLALFGRIAVFYFRSLKAPEADWMTRGVLLGGAGALAGFHVNGLFEWNFGDSEIVTLLWITIGLALAASRLESGRK